MIRPFLPSLSLIFLIQPSPHPDTSLKLRLRPNADANVSAQASFAPQRALLRCLQQHPVRVHARVIHVFTPALARQLDNSGSRRAG